MMLKLLVFHSSNRQIFRVVLALVLAGCVSSVFFSTPWLMSDVVAGTQPLGSTINSIYTSTSILGFELTPNIYDNAGAGYLIGHRNSSKLVFTFNDGTRVSGATHRLTFSGYGNALLVGGRSANPTVAYYEGHQFTPLVAVVNVNGTFSIVHEPDGRVVLNVADSSVGASSDYFVMESLNDNGHVVIVLWGITQYGTLASGVYFNLEFSNPGRLNQGWYVMHWQDSNSNGIPDPADTFTVTSSGT